MTEERLKLIVAAYGSDMKRWPEADRLAAEQVLQRSPAIWAAATEARRLDALLDRDRPHAPSPALLETILARAAATPQEAPATLSPAPVAVKRPVTPQQAGGILSALQALFAPGSLWPGMAGLAAAAVIGFMVGSSGLVDFGDNGTGASTLVGSAAVVYEASDWGAVL